jgi:hypothetical protein
MVSFLRVFCPNILHALIISNILATCPAHLIVIEVIPSITFREWRSYHRVHTSGSCHSVSVCLSNHSSVHSTPVELYSSQVSCMFLYPPMGSVEDVLTVGPHVGSAGMWRAEGQPFALLIHRVGTFTQGAWRGYSPGDCSGKARIWPLCPPALPPTQARGFRDFLQCLRVFSRKVTWNTNFFFFQILTFLAFVRTRHIVLRQ